MKRRTRGWSLRVHRAMSTLPCKADALDYYRGCDCGQP